MKKLYLLIDGRWACLINNHLPFFLGRKLLAEERIRFEIKKCRRCDACRELMDISCLVFPEIFRLIDENRSGDEVISTEDLGRIANLCNLCGVCPCRDIRSSILAYKIYLAESKGLGMDIRLMEGVEQIGKIGGKVPALSNAVCSNSAARYFMEKFIGIHRGRKFPLFPEQSFDNWLKKRKKKDFAKSEKTRKVAYFTGCTARYLFPEVARSVVEVFEKNKIKLKVLDSQCCGMPMLLEGDSKQAFVKARQSVELLFDLCKSGYDIICSCPTCGYLLKRGLNNDSEPEVDNPRLEETIYDTIDPKVRRIVAQNTYDAGEYLSQLNDEKTIDLDLASINKKAVYYASCHMREQKINNPYMPLMEMVPGLNLKSIDSLYCCGNGGIMGFKKQFYKSSLKIASPLVAKIKSYKPEILVTECLSCRLQFNQMTNYQVYHPVEIIRMSYNDF